MNLAGSLRSAVAASGPMVAVPVAVYLVGFCVLTFPLVTKFNGAFFCDSVDGASMIWNVWWVDQAVTQRKESLFFTDLLHFPAGTSLRLHSLTPMNGILALPLHRSLSLVQVYNTLVLTAFVGSGLTMFWLAKSITNAYVPSLAAGWVFTFSLLHFSHAPGHLHQTATQFLPLCLLLLYRCAVHRSTMCGIGAGGALLAVLWCDHYQFLAASLFALIVVTWTIFRLPSAHARRWILAVAAFIATAGLGTGWFVLAMWRDSHGQRFVGTHDAEMFSADMLGLLIPGWPWQYAWLTKSFWMRHPNHHEASVSLSIGVLIAAGVAWRRRTSDQSTSAALWLTTAIVFMLLSFGPTWRLFGEPITTLTPYRFFEWLVPSVGMGGCPARFMLMSHLALAVLCATGLAHLGSFQQIRKSPRRMAVAGAFTVLLVLHSQPRVLPTLHPARPAWVGVVRDYPVQGAVVDQTTAEDALGMYYQTQHRRAISSGQISRLSVRQDEAQRELHALVDRGDFDVLAERGFALIVRARSRGVLELPIVFEDAQVRVFALPPRERR